MNDTRSDSPRPVLPVHPIVWVHRVGAVVVAVILWVFAALGFASGTGFVTTHGARMLGMTGNGLLSTISVVVGVILVVSAVLGGWLASTICAVVGGLFLLSGLVHLAVIHTPANILAFTLPNVIFSLVVGIVLLFVGLYGRASGNLPAGNPYRRSPGGSHPMMRMWHGESMTQDLPKTEAEAERRLAEASELAEAEHAMAEGHATPEQEREVITDASRRQRQRRTEAWRRAIGQGWTRSS